MSTTCPVCFTPGSPLISEGKDFFVRGGASKDFGICLCAQCKFGFSIPQMDTSMLAEYYPPTYEAYQPKQGWMARLQSIKHRSDYRILHRALTYKEHPVIFEIGAGRGEFLTIAKQAGAIVEGQEPGEAGRDFALKHLGISLQPGFAEEVEFTSPKDAVILRHVLEHVQDPVAVLKNIFSRGLKPGATLFLKLPNLRTWELKVFGKFWDNLDLPRHRFHFTDLGIKTLLSRLGFTDIKVQLERVPSSIMRSLLYAQKHSPNAALRAVLLPYSLLPGGAQILLAQAISYLFFLFPAGRMIVTAKKPSQS